MLDEENLNNIFGQAQLEGGVLRFPNSLCEENNIIMNLLSNVRWPNLEEAVIASLSQYFCLMSHSAIHSLAPYIVKYIVNHYPYTDCTKEYFLDAITPTNNGLFIRDSWYENCLSLYSKEQVGFVVELLEFLILQRNDEQALQLYEYWQAFL